MKSTGERKSDQHLEDDPQQERLDAGMRQTLAGLRPVPERDPDIVKRGRAQFLAELDEMESSVHFRETASGAAIGWINRLFGRPTHNSNYSRSNDAQEKVTMLTPRRFAITTFGAAALAAALLLGGGSTVFASRSALPGEPLYTVKTGLEQTRLTFSASAADRAELSMEYAQMRLNEIEQLVQRGRFERIDTATREYEMHINRALTELEKIASTNPVRAAALTKAISQSLAQYAQALSVMKDQVPDPVKLNMEDAIRETERHGGLDDVQSVNEMEFSGAIEAINGNVWTIAGRAVTVSAQTEVKGTFQVGDLVKVHAAPGADGSLQAREVEAVAEASPTQEGATRTPEAGDDHGGDDNPNMTRTPEVGDDHGGDDNPSITRTPEVGDDHGGDDNPNMTRTPEVGDDHGGDDNPSITHTPEPGDDHDDDNPSITRTPEPGDDHDEDNPSITRTPEPGDDHGGSSIVEPTEDHDDDHSGSGGGSRGGDDHSGGD